MKRTKELRALAVQKSELDGRTGHLENEMGFFLKSFRWKTHETYAYLRTD